MNDPVIAEVAAQYGKSPAQVMIKWALQHDVVVIPKSTNHGRIKENADIFDFDISEADMQRLDDLDENWRCTWDPTSVI